jgi:hypothetical protein
MPATPLPPKSNGTRVRLTGYEHAGTGFGLKTKNRCLHKTSHNDQALLRHGTAICTGTFVKHMTTYIRV